jgi:hypothetical protein
MTTLARSSWTTLAAALAAILALGGAYGCTVGTVPPASTAPLNDQGGGGGDQDDDFEPGSSDQADIDQIVVRFFNASDADVDTEFYATNEPLEDPATDLFSAENRVQVGIGAFGSGVVQSGDNDQIDFPCTENTVVGTAGGRYRDPDLGTLLGTGQARVIEVGLNFDCGNTIIFTYTGDNGDYSTEPPLVDFTD